MSGSLIDELRIMAEEHDDELCREALNHIEMLKNANCEYRKALSQQQNASTLRDQFAMAALPVFLTYEIDAKSIAELSYAQADAMMEARK
jgi:hypothetical protein